MLPTTLPSIAAASLTPGMAPVGGGAAGGLGMGLAVIDVADRQRAGQGAGGVLVGGAGAVAADGCRVVLAMDRDAHRLDRGAIRRGHREGIDDRLHGRQM